MSHSCSKMPLKGKNEKMFLSNKTFQLLSIFVSAFWRTSDCRRISGWISYEAVQSSPRKGNFIFLLFLYRSDPNYGQLNMYQISFMWSVLHWGWVSKFDNFLNLATYILFYRAGPNTGGIWNMTIWTLCLVTMSSASRMLARFAGWER